LILGEDEALAAQVSIKFLRDDIEQQTLPFDEAIAYLQSLE